MTPRRFTDLSLREFFDAVSAKTPAPGGGAVAATTAALGAALGRMVLAYSIGKKSLAPHDGALREADRQLHTLREMFLRLGEEDAEAYALVNELQRLPEGDPRRAGLAAAVRTSIDVPRTVLGACVEMLRRLDDLTAITNPHLRSDLAIAGVLGEAGARSAWWNVRVNVALLEDRAERDALMLEADTLLGKAWTIREVIEGACRA
ncbi:MAG: cyclodeaminase/cyclohydrolase family protein [Planctomycetota bacterium]|nr:cyclodeaminase/cyclohydrolase family protein [Planctomycetota bacterium]